MNLLPVSAFTRLTIADGDALNKHIIEPLSGNDVLLADSLYNLSGKSYMHDPVTNSIFHYKDNDPTKEKVYAFSAQSITADNIYNTNLSATNVTATNTTATNVKSTNTISTNVTATNLSAVSENVYVLSASNSVPKKLVDIIQNLLTHWQNTENYIDANEDTWSSISAISAQGMSAPFTGNTFALSAGKNMTFTVVGNDTVKMEAAQQDTIYARHIRTEGENEIYSLVIV